MPNNDVGKPESITNKTFESAAEAMGMSMEESRENAFELLGKMLETKDEITDKNWKAD